MTRVSDKMFDLAIKLYACSDADMHDANAIRLAVAKLERENERLRTRVGWLDHLDTPEGRATHATEAVRVENEELRADLREAMELLRAHGQPPTWMRWKDIEEWDTRWRKLLAKHKETP